MSVEAIKRFRRVLEIFSTSEAEVRPHCVLVGPSGSGKSHTVQTLCEELDMSMFEINAAALTKEGTSGNSLSKALAPLLQSGGQPIVCFVDEFDKLFQRNGETTESFRSAVQDEFLTSLESKYTSVFTDYGKYEPVVVENSLFIFAGAYSNQKIETMQQLKDAGLRTEFVGRVPLVYSTQEVSLEELKSCIPKIKLFTSYRKLFNKRPVNKDVEGITRILRAQSEEMNIGIRLLNSAIHQHFMAVK